MASGIPVCICFNFHPISSHLNGHSSSWMLYSTGDCPSKWCC
jgi:hypothetical protein